jgi:hypothetical protein
MGDILFSLDCSECGLSDKAQSWESLEQEMKEHAALDHWDKREVIYITGSAQGSMGFLVEREPIENRGMLEKLAAFDVMIAGIGGA